MTEGQDVIRLQERRKALKIEKKHGMLGEKLTAVVGPTYFLAFCAGGVYGAVTAKSPAIKRSSLRLKMNFYLNTVGKSASRFANYSAAALFLYLIIAKSTDYIFQEELDSLSGNGKAAFYGALTGAVYRVTYPYQAVIFASGLGAGMGAIFNTAWERGLISARLI